MVLPVLFALGAALSNALATVLQRKATLTVPKAEGLRVGLILDLLRRPVRLVGLAAVITAGVCQAVALATGPVTVVQPSSSPHSAALRAAAAPPASDSPRRSRTP